MHDPIANRTCPVCNTPLDPIFHRSARYCSKQCADPSDSEDMDSPRANLKNSGFKSGAAPLWVTSEKVRSVIITPLADVHRLGSNQRNPLYILGEIVSTDVTLRALGNPIRVTNMKLDDKLVPGTIVLRATIDHFMYDDFFTKPYIIMWAGKRSGNRLNEGVSFVSVGDCCCGDCIPSWQRSGWICSRSWSEVPFEHLIPPCIDDWAPPWHLDRRTNRSIIAQSADPWNEIFI